jgi:hypothetical protein
MAALIPVPHMHLTLTLSSVSKYNTQFHLHKMHTYVLTSYTILTEVQFR